MENLNEAIMKLTSQAKESLWKYLEKIKINNYGTPRKNIRDQKI